MIHLFHKIRRQLIDIGRVRKYLFYALGEIILVVIGILIALEVNNRNDAHQTRAKELVYLQKLKADLENSNQKMDQFILKQKQYVTAAQEIIDHIEGKPILDWQVFNEQCISIYD